MKKILFRGKRIDNGEWVEGYYVETLRYNNMHWIWDGKEYIAVDPTTVGQYTGINDRNGDRIFEGDMFRMDDECIGVIIFKDGCFRLQMWGMCGTYTESGYDECGGGWGVVECEPIDWYYVHDMKIAGNIHDNPELMEVDHE